MLADSTSEIVFKALIVPSSRTSPVIQGLGFGVNEPSVAVMGNKHQSITIDEEGLTTSRSLSELSREKIWKVGASAAAV